MRKGTLVQLVAIGPMGTLDRIDATRFADEVVRRGDRGRYWGTHHDLPGWHIVEFDTPGGVRYCPLASDAFRRWKPNPESSPGTDGLAQLLP
jgi:hypothetical protein